MLHAFKNGQTSVILRAKLLDSTSTVGAGLTGLTSASTGLIISTIADNEATATAYTVAGSTVETITTLGTYAAPTATKCRFKEVDSTNHKGLYEFQFADARFAVSSAKSLIVSVLGATNLQQADFLIQLQSDDPFVAKPTNYASLSIDASGRVDVIKINGTSQTARDLGASVLLSSGTGTGQLDFTSGVVKANATQWLGGTIPAVNVTGVPLVDVKYLLGTAWLTPGTAGTPDVNVKLWNGLATVALPLVPTVAGRTLDVSAGGEAGVDWANVGSPTTSLALTGTTIATTQKVDLETIKTNPVVNAGTVTFPTNLTLANATALAAVQADTDDIQTRLPAALLTGGRLPTAVAANVGEVGMLATLNDTDLGFVVACRKITLPAAGYRVESLSFYIVTPAGGHVRLALYDDTGTAGNPGALKAETTSVAVVAGWNVMPVAAPVVLAAGNYWIAYQVDSNSIQDNKVAAVSGSACYYAKSYGAFDATFNATPTAEANVWQAFATFDISGADVGITQTGADKVWASAARTLTSFGTLASDVWAVATRVLTAGTNIVLAKGVGVTGFNDLDAAGVRTAVGLASANLDTQLDALPTAAETSDAVWDELLSGHAVSGSTGEALTAASAAGDPWATALPGAYGAGTAGKIIGDNIDATISSRTKPADTQAAVTLVATTTNLTNAPTAGDLTATMKASVTTAATAATPTVTAGTVSDKTGYALTSGERTSIAAAVWASVMEGSRTAIQYMRGFGATLLGKASGMATTTATFRDVDDSKDRVVATVDADGNRSAVTLDLT